MKPNQKRSGGVAPPTQLKMHPAVGINVSVVAQRCGMIKHFFRAQPCCVPSQYLHDGKAIYLAPGAPKPPLSGEAQP